MSGALSSPQSDLIGALDDAVEHVVWEWDQPDPNSVGTCGFARIDGIDGRSSFVQRAKSLADRDGTSQVTRDRRHRPRSGRVAPVSIEIGSLDLSLRPNHDSGYRLTINNIPELVGGPAHQRLSVRRELHELLLNRLQHNGYLDDAYVRGRMD